ncbi:MAG TPA: type II toxin-antitoxin system PemK/MazF family toxin [Vicinamibacteria bacterium]|nr:type II toxin-antitoxin system PemK/MazF family toxin [Vicinamibacteria bacterium]
MERGEIWWATLGRPHGSEPGHRRPVLVVQSDDFNRSGIATAVTLAITTNMKLAFAPGNVVCRPRSSGLARPSVVNVSQVATVDRRDLVERAGRLTEPLMRRVDEGLRLALSL